MKGWLDGGVESTITSKPAPAIFFDFKASNNASSSINGPLAQFIRNESDFIKSNCFCPIILCVSSVYGECRETKSEH